jgi:chaperonin cofactor prefoldin
VTDGAAQASSLADVPSLSLSLLIDAMMQEIDTLQDEVSKIKKTLAELKVKLYAKFGSAINLDE